MQAIAFILIGKRRFELGAGEGDIAVFCSGSGNRTATIRRFVDIDNRDGERLVYNRGIRSGRPDTQIGIGYRFMIQNLGGGDRPGDGIEGK